MINLTVTLEAETVGSEPPDPRGWLCAFKVEQPETNADWENIQELATRAVLRAVAHMRREAGAMAK